MNIYEKLEQARKIVAESDLKKSGKNQSFNYFELEDILPTIQRACRESKIMSFITFDSEKATLTIIDLEKPEDKVVFTSPMVDSDLARMTKIQSLGANETYQRRYLYLTAFEIIEKEENDLLYEDLNSHNLYKIKERIEQKITNKIAKGLTQEEVLRSIGKGISIKDFNTYMTYFDILNKIDKELDK